MWTLKCILFNCMQMLIYADVHNKRICLNVKEEIHSQAKNTHFL